ncbi:hypothetical protein DND34_04800 [Bifidobacterium longum subsp. longum]|nr:hypothetical protein DND34_04800 [Bifidobacterium longum subsp. longum]
MFPATVFVSVASGHLTLLAVGQVLQRSLEPAPHALNQWGGGGCNNPHPVHAAHPDHWGLAA